MRLERLELSPLGGEFLFLANTLLFFSLLLQYPPSFLLSVPVLYRLLMLLERL